MVYEVCALVAAIVLGVLGIELALMIRSTRKLINEATKTVVELNHQLPNMLDDVQKITNVVRKTSEQVGGTVNEVAVGIDEIWKNPLIWLRTILDSIKNLVDLWNDLRGRKKEA